MKRSSPSKAPLPKKAGLSTPSSPPATGRNTSFGTDEGHHQRRHSHQVDLTFPNEFSPPQRPISPILSNIIANSSNAASTNNLLEVETISKQIYQRRSNPASPVERESYTDFDLGAETLRLLNKKKDVSRHQQEISEYSFSGFSSPSQQPVRDTAFPSRSQRGSMDLGVDGDEENILLDEVAGSHEINLEQLASPSRRRYQALNSFPLASSRGESSKVAAVINFANSIVGAGIIGLPHAFLQSGLGLGTILMVGLTYLVNWTVLLLIKNGKLAGRSNYQELCFHCFGKPGLIFISIFQFAFAFGGLCAYLVIVGDNVGPVISHMMTEPLSPFQEFITNRKVVIFFSTVLVMLPLSLYRDLSKLAKTSFLAIISILFILFAIIIEGRSVPETERGLDIDGEYQFAHPHFMQAISVMSFAFVCHHNSFLLHASMSVPSLDNFSSVTHWATGTSCLVSLIFGVCGYLIFRDKTEANILNNFSPNDGVINIARITLAANMYTTFPLELFVAREVIEEFFFAKRDFSLTRHIYITLMLTIASLLIALTVCDLGTVLEMTGGLSATMLAYILPPAIYLRLSSGPLFIWKKVPYIICFLFGVAIMLASMFSTFSNLLDPNSQASTKKCL